MGRAPSSRVIRARPCAPPGSRSGSSGLGSSATSLAAGAAPASRTTSAGRAGGGVAGAEAPAPVDDAAAAAVPGTGLARRRSRRGCGGGAAHPGTGQSGPRRLRVVQDIDREVQGQDIDDGLAQPLVVAALGDCPHVPRLGDGHRQGAVGAGDRGGGVEGGPGDPARGRQPLEDRRPRIADPGDRGVVTRRGEGGRGRIRWRRVGIGRLASGRGGRGSCGCGGLGLPGSAGAWAAAAGASAASGGTGDGDIGGGIASQLRAAGRRGGTSGRRHRTGRGTGGGGRGLGRWSRWAQRRRHGPVPSGPRPVACAGRRRDAPA